MGDITEKRAIELSWNKVRCIVTEEIEEVLGFHIQCKINVVVGSFWDATFIDYRLPLPKLCQILQTTQATPEDWEEALPDEGVMDVNGIGMVLCEKLIGRNLKFPWEHHLITEDSLWLIDVTESKNQEAGAGAASQRSFR